VNNLLCGSVENCTCSFISHVPATPLDKELLIPKSCPYPPSRAFACLWITPFYRLGPGWDSWLRPFEDAMSQGFLMEESGRGRSRLLWSFSIFATDGGVRRKR
jgi:hypothetical protein